MLKPLPVSMTIEQKISLLDAIYRIYGEFIRSQPLACERSCATCCTGNTTLTTLEGYRILSSLNAAQEQELLTAIHHADGSKRFKPELTFNRIAELCMQGRDIPEEPMDLDRGVCALLSQLECPVYAARPFGCRCMVSKVRCDRSGYADMDELILSVNHLFIQYIEHIDIPGMTGNLLDVLGFLEPDSRRSAYACGRIQGTPEHLIPNAPIPVLMIPPRHRQRIQPILKSLNALLR